MSLTDLGNLTIIISAIGTLVSTAIGVTWFLSRKLTRIVDNQDIFLETLKDHKEKIEANAIAVHDFGIRLELLSPANAVARQIYIICLLLM